MTADQYDRQPDETAHDYGLRMIHLIRLALAAARRPNNDQSESS